jgi:hypothetical protein
MLHFQMLRTVDGLLAVAAAAASVVAALYCLDAKMALFLHLSKADC